jgi:hypothetical protein
VPAFTDGLSAARHLLALSVALCLGLALWLGLASGARAEGAASGLVTLHLPSQPHVTSVTREVRVDAKECSGPAAGAGVPLTVRVRLSVSAHRVSLGVRHAVPIVELIEHYSASAAVTAAGKIRCETTVALPHMVARVGSAALELSPSVHLVLQSPGSWTAQLTDTQTAQGPVTSAQRHLKVEMKAILGEPNAAALGTGTLAISLPGRVRLAESAPASFDARLTLGAGSASCGLVTRLAIRVGGAGSRGSDGGAVMPGGECERSATLVPADAGSASSTAPATTDAAVSGAEEPASWVGWGYAAAAPVTATYTAPNFITLAAHMPLRYTRLVVPFDALATSVDGRCVRDEQYALHQPGETWAVALQGWLAAVQPAGEQPMLSIGWGGATADDAGTPLHELNQNPTDAQYRCGLTALMQATQTWSREDGTAPVTEWEAFNEPDIKTCATQAASYYVDAVRVDAALGRSDTIIAGAFRDWDDPYIDRHIDCGHANGDWYIPDYVHALERDGVWPKVFSLHPFVDVSASGAYEDGDLSVQVADTLRYLNSQPEPASAMWLTESGVWLENQVHDSSGATFGSDLDGDPLKQAWGAVGFLNLAYSAGQAYHGQVARIYWYEFQPDGDGHSPGSAAFDSGLMGISDSDWTESGRYVPAAGEYAVPRASYCVLAYGDSPVLAAQDTRCDWSSGPENPSTDWEVPSGG